MSNIEKFERAKDIVLSSEYSFKKLADIHGAITWEREAAFSVQLLKNNNYLASVAYGNPDSLRDAVLNVAAIGLSLNPTRGLCYLVPRDGKVCLDISYKGFLQLAIDSGAILWARCEPVFEQDEFLYNGAGEKPTHSFDPFSVDRGALRGCYCVVKLPNGDYLTDMMAIADIYSIRDRSVSWKAFKKKGTSCPWSTDEMEMVRKTVIRRAFKMWPLPTESANRLEKALDSTFEDHEIDITPSSEKKDELINSIRGKLEFLDKAEDEKFFEYLSRVNSREVDSLEALTEYETSKLDIMLSQWVEKKLEENKEKVVDVEPAFELEEVEDAES